MTSFSFSVQKKSEEIKERAVANDSQQRSWPGKEDTSSLTVATDSVIVTAATDAFEQRCTATENVSNAFVQTLQLKRDKQGDRFTMKIAEELVDILSLTNEKLCAPCIVKKEKKKAICVITERAIHEMSISALKHHEKFRTLKVLNSK